MFAYCRNNPVSRKDALGTDDVTIFFDDGSDGDVECEPIDPDEMGGSGGLKINAGQFNGSNNQNGKNASTNQSADVAIQSKGSRAGFRGALQRLTGKTGAGFHAHHVYPFALRDKFDKLGIAYNDAKNGAWWEAQSHLQNAYEYNQWWEAFFDTPDVTSTTAEILAEFLAALFGFEIGN